MWLYQPWFSGLIANPGFRLAQWNSLASGRWRRPVFDLPSSYAIRFTADAVLFLENADWNPYPYPPPRDPAPFCNERNRPSACVSRNHPIVSSNNVTYIVPLLSRSGVGLIVFKSLIEVRFFFFYTYMHWSIIQAHPQHERK